MEDFAPPSIAPGMVHLRGSQVYPYLRNNVFRSFQKFNKALRHIYACKPTGVKEQQKMNMAVAIFKGEVNKMDYEHKD